MFQYSINLAWSDEDGGYIATIPEFPNLSAFGENPEEAIHEAKVAAELYIEVMEEDGEKIPEPRKLDDFSGQIRVRMPRSLHRKLSTEAEREGVSLNTYIVSRLEEQYGIEKAIDIALKRLEKPQPSILVYKADQSSERSHSVGSPSWIQNELHDDLYERGA